MGSTELMQRRILLPIIVGLIFVMFGTIMMITADYFPFMTVRVFYVNEVGTHSYSTDFFPAEAEDKIVIDVDVSGGIANNILIRKQNGERIFEESRDAPLRYVVSVPSNDTYIVFLTARDYVNLSGTIALKRAFNFYAVGIGIIALGLALIVGSSIICLYQRRRLRPQAI